MDQPKANETLPAVPASTAEVSIRTLSSDLEMIGKSGGMALPQFTRVAVSPVNSPAPGPAGVPAPRVSLPVKEDSSVMKGVIWTLVILSATAFLFLGGYYLAPFLSK